MKKGKWNYTENIEYRVVLVELHKVDNPVLHWQNAFTGETHQAVEVYCQNGYKFLIHNEDGSGLLKITNGGGPDSYHASIDYANCEVLQEVPPEAWIKFRDDLREITTQRIKAWQKENHPEEYEYLRKMLKALKGQQAKTN